MWQTAQPTPSLTLTSSLGNTRTRQKVCWGGLERKTHEPGNARAGGGKHSELATYLGLFAALGPDLLLSPARLLHNPVARATIGHGLLGVLPLRHPAPALALGSPLCADAPLLIRRLASLDLDLVLPLTNPTFFAKDRDELQNL